MRYVQNRFAEDGKVISTVMNVEDNVVYIYDYIYKESYYYDSENKPNNNEVSSENFLNHLRSAVKNGDITVRINTQGGNVGYALSIYQTLRESTNKVTTVVDGYAYSCGSWILLAGEDRLIMPGGIVMTHNPSMYAFLDSEQAFENTLAEWKANKESVVELTSNRTGLSKETVSEMMNKTTFMTAKQAIENKFCTAVIDGNASIPSGMKNYLPSVIGNALPEFVEADYSDLLSRSLSISAKKLLKS